MHTWVHDDDGIWRGRCARECVLGVAHAFCRGAQLPESSALHRGLLLLLLQARPGRPWCSTLEGPLHADAQYHGPEPLLRRMAWNSKNCHQYWNLNTGRAVQQLQPKQSPITSALMVDLLAPDVADVHLSIAERGLNGTCSMAFQCLSAKHKS